MPNPGTPRSHDLMHKNHFDPQGVLSISVAEDNFILLLRFISFRPGAEDNFSSSTQLSVSSMRLPCRAGSSVEE
jgi:hypothetical protein